MDSAIELAGFIVAHSVWCVSEGETLVPLIAYDTSDGKRHMLRLASDRMEDGAASGNEWLATNPDHASRAVLVYDGFITIQNKKTDALIVIVRDYSQGEAELTMALPYRPATDSNAFAVHRPKFIDFKGGEPGWDKVAQAFWVGVESHEKGAKVWNEHLDESM